MHKLGLAITLAGMLVAAGTADIAHAKGPAQVGPATVQVEELPREARETERLIRSGGPFPYAKDGAVFGNRERLLPPSARGYYREYTVPTPGAGDRGARRIVCGGRQPVRPEACYYTADHYASFRLIAQ